MIFPKKQLHLETFVSRWNIVDICSVPGSNAAAHPGLGPETGEETVHAYYQWVPFVLFLQVMKKPFQPLHILKEEIAFNVKLVLGRHVLHPPLPVESL